MAAVLHYQKDSFVSKRVWKENAQGNFDVIVKYYLYQKEQKKLQALQITSKRPASLEECKMMAQKLIKDYGDDLKQIFIWNLDQMRNEYPDWVKI